MAVTATQVESLYLAYFGRPAEPAGLTYWTSQTNATVDQVSAAFAQQPEYTNVYGGLTRTQVVNTLYQNLFGRAAQSNELNYWVGSTDVTVDRLALALTNGATGTDRLTLDSKAQYASFVTTNAATTATATDVKATLTNATVSAPNAAGTTANLSLSAYLAANTSNTPASFYNLLASQTANTQKFILAGSTLTDGNGTAATSINFGANATAGSIALQAATGTDTLTLAAANKATDVTLAGTSGTAAGVAAAATSITLAESASVTTPIVTTVHLNIADAPVAATSNTINLSGLTALTTVDGANSTSALTLGTTAAHLSLANLANLTTGSGNDVLFVDTASSTASVKAAALTINSGAGNDQITSIVNDGALTINSGAGNDTITATATGKAALTITAGAGNDSVIIGSTATGSTAATVAHNVSITLGDGNDVVSLAQNAGGTATAAFQTVQAYTAVTSTSTAAAVTAADTALKAGLVSITDFNVATDTLALGSLTTVSLTNAQIGAISSASSLSQAVQIAASDLGATGGTANSTAAGKAVAFQYGSDTYIFVNNSDAANAATGATATVDNGDGLIQLSGVTATQLTAANFTHA